MFTNCSYVHALVSIFIRNVKGPESSHAPVIQDSHELVELALKCVYASKR